jgi:lytic murein transglycosylase
MSRTLQRFFATLVLALAAATPASAACGNAAGFPAFLESFKRDAAQQGISAATIAAALDGLSFDPSTVSKDRGQGVFSQTFLQFSDRMVAAYRMQRGAALMKQYAATFQRIESQFGVPAYPIVAFWGLETDFGANTGKDNTLRSLATLAWDCRRPDMFRGELLDALRVIQRGDLTPAEMRGPWAGELGQMQFLPSHYFTHGVDFDGDGRRDLIKSVPDALASAGKYLQSFGWKRGEPWLQEVHVPPDLDWKEADLAIKHPRSQWVRWGVRAASGSLPADNLQAALLLPMGRGGPAFLAYPNFDTFLGWNQSFVYATTAAYFAARLAGAPAVQRGNPTPGLNAREVAELQRGLARQGLKVGKIDGKLGLETRAAVKQAQLRLGLPADSWPTQELLGRLR